MSLWVTNSSPVELRPNFTEDDLQIVIRAVYKQILGNAYILDRDCFASAESMLRNGDITVRGFVSMIAKSELYQSLFFESTSQYRFIELNFKHLLGRAPQSQAEISEHVVIYNTSGYDAEINSYIDSDEYTQTFGEDIVPYVRSNQSQVGISNNAFNRTFTLYRGEATSDTSSSSKLIASIASNLATKIANPAVGNGANYGSTGKRFRIAFVKGGTTPTQKQSNKSFEIGYDQMSARIQAIQKTGGKIVSITEVA